MRPSFRVCCAVLCLSAGFVLPIPAQTELPPCREHVYPPDGMCGCAQQIYRGEYSNAEKEYRVRLPEGVAAISSKAPCASSGFRIYLTHPNAGDFGRSGDFAWSQIYVGRTERTNQTLQEIADGFAQHIREDSERVHATDLQIDQPVPRSLSSFSAVDLKATRTEGDRGSLIREEIVAKSPDNSVYFIGMISPAYRYEKDHELFKAVAEGFSYTATENVQK